MWRDNENMEVGGHRKIGRPKPRASDVIRRHEGVETEDAQDRNVEIEMLMRRIIGKPSYSNLLSCFSSNCGKISDCIKQFCIVKHKLENKI